MTYHKNWYQGSPGAATHTYSGAQQAELLLALYSYTRSSCWHCTPIPTHRPLYRLSKKLLQAPRGRRNAPQQAPDPSGSALLAKAAPKLGRQQGAAARPAAPKDAPSPHGSSCGAQISTTPGRQKDLVRENWPGTGSDLVGTWFGPGSDPVRIRFAPGSHLARIRIGSRSDPVRNRIWGEEDVD